ncbi:MAG: YbaB/EbfC family nucleoid-associated protein [Patescibacteria group bacterium]
MFNKLKQFKDLRDQAKELQSKLAQESVSSEKNGVKITLDGNLEMTGIEIETSFLNSDKKNKLEETIKEVHKDALKKIQRVMAMKMKEMGGLPNIPGIN